MTLNLLFPFFLVCAFIASPATADDRALISPLTPVAVSAGGLHSCGIKTDGTLACWGSNGNGQSTPPAGTFTEVSAGTFHSCGLRSDGTVACWGLNNYGQALPPAGVFREISAGGLFTCGLKTDGTVACWGDDSSGHASTVLRVHGITAVGSYYSLSDAFSASAAGDIIELMQALVYCQDADFAAGGHLSSCLPSLRNVIFVQLFGR